VTGVQAWAAGCLIPADRAVETAHKRKELAMLIILAVLLLALILGGLGFALHVLWWVALVVLVIWLVGFLFREVEGAGTRRRRWYRW
jgi:hypothetical protein